MFNSLKSILGLVIGTFIIILVIVIVINLGNRNVKQTPKPIQNIGVIDKSNNNNEVENNELESLENEDDYIDDNLETMVDTPDTASTNTISIIIGSIIGTSGIFFITKKNN